MTFKYEVDLDPADYGRLHYFLGSKIDPRGDGKILITHIEGGRRCLTIFVEKRASWTGWNPIFTQFLGETSRNMEEFFTSNNLPFKFLSWQCTVGQE